MPVFSVGGWYDNFAESDLEAFAALHKLDGRLDDRHRIMIGPWAHNMSTPFPGVTYGDDSSSPIRSYQIEWFDHWLKGAPEDAQRFSPEKWHAVRAEVDEAPVHIFVMGVNRWRDEPDWPLARARTTALYLAGQRAANSLNGGGVLQWKPERAKMPDSPFQLIRLPTTRAIRCLPAAARCVATRRFSPGGPSINGPWRSAGTCWCTPALR